MYHEIGESLNRETTIIQGVPDPEERRRLNRPIGETMANVRLELMRPIVREYPELDPDKGEFDRT